MVQYKAVLAALQSLSTDISKCYPNLTNEDVSRMENGSVLHTTPYLKNVLTSNISIQASLPGKSIRCMFIYSGKDGSLISVSRNIGGDRWIEC